MTVALQAFSGNHHEIGVHQGQAVRESIHALLEQLPDFEVVERIKPRLLHTSLFLFLAKRKAAQMLREEGKIGESRIVTILRDHGKDNKPSSLTICRHATPTSTLRSVIFYPDRRTIKVLYGKPCQNEYSEFVF